MPIRCEAAVNVEVYSIATWVKHECHRWLSDMVYGLNQIVALDRLTGTRLLSLRTGIPLAILRRCTALSAAYSERKSLRMNRKYWQQAAVSALMSAALLGTSSLASAQGRRGRGE